MQMAVCLRIFLLLPILLSLSCGNAEKPVQGSVFIVTQGADNIKLGLVRVSAIREADITNFIEQKKGSVAGATTNLQGEADLIKPEIEKCQADSENAKKAYDGAKTQIDALKSREQTLNLAYNPYASAYASPYLDEVESPELTAEAAKQRNMGKQLDAVRKQIRGQEGRLAKLDGAKSEAEKRLDERKAQLAGVQLKILGFVNPAFLLDGIPEGTSKTVTDADGKFSLNLPVGKYALAASSQRRVGTTTEEYNWLIWVDVSSDGAKQITLSNQNLLGEDSDESIFKVKELLPSLNNGPDKSKDVNFKI